MSRIIDEEIKNLQLDRPGRGKSPEQLRRHTLNDHFENKPVERALYLLTKGDEVQKISIIQQLPQLVSIDENATYSRILPKIQQELPSSSSEFHINASKIYQVFLVNPKAPPNLLTAVLQGIESRDLIVVNAWLETLIAVIPTLHEDSIRKEIMPIAVAKAGLTQPVMSRIASCSILGKVAIHPRFKPLDIKKEVLPVVQSLCQDVQPEVRASICQQLPNVAQGLGEEFLKVHLLPCLVELASDNNALVKSAAITSTVNMLKYMNAETKKGTIVPLVKKLLDSALAAEDVTANAIAKEIGALIQGLTGSLSANETTNFLQCYKTLARRGISTRTGDARLGDPSRDVICRDRCAYNLPAIMQTTVNVVPDQLEQMYSIFRELAADPCYIVRRTVGGCIHEIAKILGPSNKLMKPDLVRLLRDDAEEVLQTLVPNIGLTLELFCKHGVLSKERSDQATMEIGRALLKCQLELTKGYNWRLLSEYLVQLERFSSVVPADFIHQHFTPVVLSNVMNGRAKPVRSQACRTLLVFLKNNNKENQQKWLRDSLISELCYSNSSYTRRFYIILCSHALNIFPDKYFKDYFFLPLISLADDPIANIRYMFVNLLPQLNKMMATPADARLKQLLADSVMKLESTEKDHDVLVNLKSKLRTSTNLIDKSKQTSAPTQNYPRGGPQMVIQKTSSKSTLTSSGNRSLPPHHPPQQQQGAGDMNFLEQHFYIDAGVTLPLVPEKEDLAVEGDINPLDISPLNITDDVKVNLRKMSKLTEESDNSSKIAKVNKRHSSVFSSSCLEKDTRKANNRRSLNIPVRENSRIPISSSKSVKDLHNKTVDKNSNNIVRPNVEKPLRKSSIPLMSLGNIDGSSKDADAAIKENILPPKSVNRQASNLPLYKGRTVPRRR